MRRLLILLFLSLLITQVRSAEPTACTLFVSNERSGDVTVIDGGTDAVVATIPVGKRPRGIHSSPDARLLYVALSGSPRMGPGVDRSRAVADRSADGIGVIDAAARKFLKKLPAGSDPEQFALTKEGTRVR